MLYMAVPLQPVKNREPNEHFGEGQRVVDDHEARAVFPNLGTDSHHRHRGTGSTGSALTANKSNLWYGGDEGIEIVNRTGVNLAYTEEDPRIDPVMTNHARKMDQALLKIGKRSYLAYGWALTSPMMVVGDDGLIIIDPPESLEAGREPMTRSSPGSRTRSS
jgi:hypothetical protein